MPGNSDDQCEVIRNSLLRVIAADGQTGGALPELSLPNAFRNRGDANLCRSSLLPIGDGALSRIT
jgi:hypothetical protein